MKAWAGNPRKMREELEAKTGLGVQCALLDDGEVGVEFCVIPGPNPWRKAFVVPVETAVPDTFLAMLDAWRKQMNLKIDRKDTAGVLGAVLAEKGEPIVRQALHSKGWMI